MVGADTTCLSRPPHEDVRARLPGALLTASTFLAFISSVGVTIYAYYLIPGSLFSPFLAFMLLQSCIGVVNSYALGRITRPRGIFVSCFGLVVEGILLLAFGIVFTSFSRLYIYVSGFLMYIVVWYAITIVLHRKYAIIRNITILITASLFNAFLVVLSVGFVVSPLRSTTIEIVVLLSILSIGSLLALGRSLGTCALALHWVIVCGMAAGAAASAWTVGFLYVPELLVLAVLGFACPFLLRVKLL